MTQFHYDTLLEAGGKFCLLKAEDGSYVLVTGSGGWYHADIANSYYRSLDDPPPMWCVGGGDLRIDRRKNVLEFEYKSRQFGTFNADAVEQLAREAMADHEEYHTWGLYVERRSYREVCNNRNLLPAPLPG